MNKLSNETTKCLQESKNEELTIKVVKTAWTETRDDIDYLYMDGCLHARLKDYGWKKETVTGFEGKLNFLLTYIVNYYVQANLMTPEMITRMLDKNEWKKIWDDVTDKISSGDCLKPVYGAINAIFGKDKCKGLSILPAYHKKTPREGFIMTGGIKGLHVEEGEAPINAFMNTFGVADGLVSDFLRDDSYSIEISPKVEIDYSKFITKHKEKHKKSPEEINLW
jgi:hypothetical protein